MIFKNHPWHQSDQPAVLSKKDKKNLRKNKTKEFLKLFLTNIFLFPYLFFKFLFKNNNSKSNIQHSKLFYGICVNLDKGDEQVMLIEELGVKSLQIRFYLCEMENIDKYVKFAQSFGNDKEILICVVQSREYIENRELLKKDINIVFEKFSEVSNEFMIGNAINRIKWGFSSVDEYLDFYKTIQKVRDKSFKNIKLVGSSVIDFEFHFTIRTLFNSYKIHFDKVASLLYVDRRGGPKNTQYGIFDLKNKIEFLDTIVKTSFKCEDEIYITEVNWPLKNRAPYSPTSEAECVNIDDYTLFMEEYFSIAKDSKKIKKVFWHQLIAAGYGLVDNRDGVLVKMPQFYKMLEMVKSAD